MTDSIIITMIASLVALGVLFSLHAIFRPKGLKIAILLIFLSISTPVALYTPFVNALGYPIAAGNDVKEHLLSHSIDPDQIWIYMWVVDEKSGEPRAYKFPYSKQLEKSLAKAQQGTDAGVQQGIKIPPPRSGVADSLAEVEISDLYDISPGGIKHNEVANESEETWLGVCVDPYDTIPCPESEEDINRDGT